jgi:hypothetical protein
MISGLSPARVLLVLWYLVFSYCVGSASLLPAVLQGIHSATVTLQSTLNTGTSDVKVRSFFLSTSILILPKATALVSESDATTIIHSVEAFEPTILDALSQIAAKKADFVNTGI